MTIMSDYLYAGSSGSAVWKRELNEMIGIKQISGEIPVNYVLYQNYPNPFNAVTVISFDIPERSFVRLSLFDLTGREIDVLVNEYISHGRYQIN